ncbi:cell wall metabolism sensor histidine kinase WalK [Paenibacillus sp. OV219]|uniref:sensor histidine kinase n=1 Tax=Paenibacillus sp. OV219 TaxID=1884377 RepID=UPI0008BA69EA|nr:HAMP domain-containing sensor histidine kinase [Paenibacillus sp. OV219]SEO06269.1 Signal transduction histidine kinase [Paenibacillus sp. OV219]
MSIRLKLLVSYAAMLFIPLVLIMVITSLLLVSLRGELSSVQGAYESTENMFDHEVVEHVAKEMKRSIERDPELMKDSKYLDELTTELRKNDAGMIIRMDDSIVYDSAIIGQTPELMTSLPTYKGPNTVTRDHVRRLGNMDYQFIQFDFLSIDKKKSTVFIITEINPVVYFIHQYFGAMFVGLLIILIGTHVILTTYMSKNIIKPLQALRKAAREIKEGRLDFQLDVARKDEIGQLGTAFEEMRSRLQKSLEVQQQYEANRKELLASISHDLRTPLTAIRGYVDGIMEGVADTPEKNHKYMRTIAMKADQLDHLINELFLYSKLDLNRQPFQFEEVALMPFLQDWSEELQFELEKKGIALQIDIQLPYDVIVTMDRDHFRRVLNNIIQNSERYMDKAEPVIRIGAYQHPDAAVIEIMDNGTGIEPISLQHIFERFYRVDQSRNVNTGGSGLGLAIAKQIMEGHGGAIAAISKLTEGTTIQLTIPTKQGSTSV